MNSFPTNLLSSFICFHFAPRHPGSGCHTVATSPVANKQNRNNHCNETLNTLRPSARAGIRWTLISGYHISAPVQLLFKVQLPRNLFSVFIGIYGVPRQSKWKAGWHANSKFKLCTGISGQVLSEKDLAPIPWSLPSLGLGVACHLAASCHFIVSQIQIKVR